MPARGPVAQRLGRLRVEILAALAESSRARRCVDCLRYACDRTVLGCVARQVRAGRHEAHARRAMVAALSQPLATGSKSSIGQLLGPHLVGLSGVRAYVRTGALDSAFVTRRCVRHSLFFNLFPRSRGFIGMATEPAQSQRPDQTSHAPLVGNGWVQGVALVMIFGFLVMGILAYRTYTASMPMPDKVVSESGDVLFTGADITRGQELYQARGLMEYGSVLGHGAYLGPDYTAEYLRTATADVADQLRAQGVIDPRDRVITEFRTNRYNPATKTLVFTDRQAAAFDRIQNHYAAYFGENSTKYGLLPQMITDKAQIRDLTAFFAWTAWAAAAERPGHKYSYTNNWPAESRVDNGPTAPVIVWSALSLIALLGGIGIMFAVYGRWSQKVGWHSAEASTLSFRQPGEVSLTPAQRATVWFFAIVSLLFLAQTLLGAAAEHYRADLSTFFGLDLARVLPYNLARTWHVQLSLFWTAAAFLAGGIFLVPVHRPPRAAPSGLAGLRAAGRGRGGGVRLADLRGAVHLRGDPPGWAVVPAVGVSRSAAAVADPVDRRLVPVDRDHLARHARQAQRRVEDEHAVVVLLLRAGDPGLLYRRAVGRQRYPLHRRRLLAVLGGAPVGRGLPRAVHHRDGGLHVRAAGRRARADRAGRDLP